MFFEGQDQDDKFYVNLIFRINMQQNIHVPVILVPEESILESEHIKDFSVLGEWPDKLWRYQVELHRVWIQGDQFKLTSWIQWVPVGRNVLVEWSDLPWWVGQTAVYEKMKMNVNLFCQQHVHTCIMTGIIITELLAVLKISRLSPNIC